MFEELSILPRCEISDSFEIQNIKMTGYLHYLNKEKEPADFLKFSS